MSQDVKELINICRWSNLGEDIQRVRQVNPQYLGAFWRVFDENPYPGVVIYCFWKNFEKNTLEFTAFGDALQYNNYIPTDEEVREKMYIYIEDTLSFFKKDIYWKTKSQRTEVEDMYFLEELNLKNDVKDLIKMAVEIFT